MNKKFAKEYAKNIGISLVCITIIAVWVGVCALIGYFTNITVGIIVAVISVILFAAYMETRKDIGNE